MFIKLLQICRITFHINWHALMNQLNVSTYIFVDIHSKRNFEDMKLTEKC